MRKRCQDRPPRRQLRPRRRGYLGGTTRARPHEVAASDAPQWRFQRTRFRRQHVRRGHRPLLDHARPPKRAQRLVRADRTLVEAGRPLPRLAQPRGRRRLDGRVARGRDVLLRLRRRDEPSPRSRGRIRADPRRAHLDAGAAGGRGVPLGAREETNVKRPDATRVFYGMEFFDTLGMQAAFTVFAVYLVQDIGVNALQLVLLGTVSEIAIFLFEVPTGVVADTYSRRLSIIVGMILAGLSLIVVGLAAVYWVIVVAAIVRGIAGTFMSGAWEAWITDEHGVDGIGRVFLRGTQFSYLGAIVGSGLGVAIATQHLGAGIVFGGVVSVLTGIACIFVMPEHGFVRRPVEERTSPLKAMTTTAVTGGKLVRGHNILLLIVGITFFAGAASEGLDRLWEAHLIRDVGLPELFGLDPVVWFGVFNIAGLVAGIVITSFLVPRFEFADNSKLARTLLGLTIVLSVSVVIFGLAASFAVAAIAYLVARLARRLKDPLYTTWLNKNVENSSVRATVNSIASQADAIGEVAGGPAIGVVGTVASLRSALVATGLLLTPTIALFLRALRHGGREPELEEAEAHA